MVARPRPLVGLLVVLGACSSGSAATGIASSDASADGLFGGDSTVGDASGLDSAGPPGEGGDEKGSDATASRDGRAGDATEESDAAAYREPLVQPFASTSIWNMPIGSGARYVAAGIVSPSQNAVYGDDDIVVLTPSAPSTPLYRNQADWNPDVSRCPWDGGPLLFDVPMPAAFVLGDTPTTDTPNSGLAALLADGRTLKQTQPFARCTAGAPGTSDSVFADVDLYGPGTTGAHGGSGLSAIGGTLRVGELRPSSGHVRHVLKMELFAHQNYYNDGNPSDCYRWPATNCDSYFDDTSSSIVYGGTNPSLRPGSLVALAASTSIGSLGLTTFPRSCGGKGRG